MKYRNYLIILSLISVMCCLAMRKIEFKEEIPGLIKIYNAKINEVGRNICTGINNGIIYFTRFTGQKSTICEYDLISKERETIYSTNTEIDDFFIFNNNLLLLNITKFIYDKKKKLIDIEYYNGFELDLTDYNLKDSYFPKEMADDAKQLKSNRNSLLNDSNSMHSIFYIYNIDTGLTKYNIPSKLNIVEDNAAISFGRNENEIVILAGLKNAEEITKIIIYDLLNEKINLEYDATNIRYAFSPQFVTADSKYLILNDRIGFGFNFIDLENHILYKIIYFNNVEHPKTPVHIRDCTWEGNTLLLTIGDDIYTFDIEEYLRSNPEGIKLEGVDNKE